MATSAPDASATEEEPDASDAAGRFGDVGCRILAAPVVLAGLLALAFLLWQLRVEVVILFAALLFGVSLYAAARWVSLKTGLEHRPSVALCSTAVIVVLGGFVLLTQQRLSSQYGEFGERLPDAIEAAEERLEGIPVIGSLSDELRELRENFTQDGAQAPSTGAGSGSGQERGEDGGSTSMQIVQITLTTLARVGLVVILAFYMAFDGRRYVRGFLQLFPPEKRDVGSDLVRGLGTALPLWLLGRISSMAVVAGLTAPALYLLDIPLAFVLALIAGLFSFVPVLGPLASVVPAVLITLESDPSKIVWVLLVYGLVQILESWFVTPRIQDGMADVPPVLLLGAQFALGGLVGIVGVMFSTPVALAGMVAVQVVYMRGYLDEPIRLPGAPDGLDPAVAEPNAAR